jgi:hypothetical protein
MPLHRRGSRLVFLNEEKPQAKLMVHAQNDRLFQAGEGIAHLADEIRYTLGGTEVAACNYRIVVLRRDRQSKPWNDIDELDAAADPSAQYRAWRLVPRPWLPEEDQPGRLSDPGPRRPVAARGRRALY